MRWLCSVQSRASPVEEERGSPLRLGYIVLPPNQNANHRGSWWAPFVVVLEELALAAVIIGGHGLLVRFIIIVVGWTAGAFTPHGADGHEPHIWGVSVRFLIEGGEILLVGIVLAFGILSAFVTLIVGFWRRMRRP